MNPTPEPGSTLPEWLHFLESLHPAGMELGLDRVLVVYRKVFPGGFPVPAVLIGGTNGKGTTALTLEWLLRSQGMRTGTYLSPHLHRYNERVRLDAVEASDAELVAAFEMVESCRGGIPLTYFEFGTLAALWLLAGAQPDFALLEVGLGGRLDAVNVVDPVLAIICSVDLDHQQWLGSDRESVGFEKAGILRPRIDAIYGEPTPPRSVQQQAGAQAVRLRIYGRDYGAVPGAGEVTDSEAEGPVSIEFQHRALELNLPATAVPRRSAIIALQAAALLGIDPAGLDLEAMAAGVRVAGRFERLGTHPEVIVDVGHNPHAARWLARRLRQVYPQRRLLAVYGSLADKVCEAVVEPLVEMVARWYLAGLEGPRGQSGEALAARIGWMLPAGYQVLPGVGEALERAIGEAAESDLILVFGSFYTVNEARGYLLQMRPDVTVSGLSS